MIKEDLLNLVPPVLRARGWRLYTGKGRLVDLWQYGGRAVLGHNPSGLLRAFKNNAERGLYVPHPHFAEERFCKALSALLPGRSFCIYENETFLGNVLKAAALGDFQNIPDDKISPRPLLWRPFFGTDKQAALEAAPVLFPVLPCPFPGAPAVLAFDPEKAGDIPEKLPPSRRISPVALSAAARCIYDLLADPARGTPRFLKVDKALKNNAVWKRQGVYLYYTGENYTALFRCFLDAGYLLPPTPEEPAILPGELSPGEEVKLANLI